MTTWAKTVGGPGRLAAIAVTGGYLLGRAVEAGTKRAVKASREVLKARSAPYPTRDQVFRVTVDAHDDSTGLTVRRGGSFRVLEGVADSVLIEVHDDPSNPYFVSREFLQSVSDFGADEQAGPE